MIRFVLLLSSLAAFVMAAPADRPNILVVVADDVSPGYLSTYGGRTPTPNLDRLAASGARFERAYSAAPLCNPSRYTLFTGRFAGRNSAVVERSAPTGPYTLFQNTRLTPTDVTLARTLGSVGYITGHVGKWHSNFEYGPLPDFPQGGDVEDPAVDSVLKERTRLQTEAIRRQSGFEYVAATISGNLDTLGPRLPLASRHSPEWQTAAALAFIDEAAEAHRPFYLHVANTLPHSPDNLDTVDADPRYTRGGLLDPVPTDHPPRATVRARLTAAGLPANGEIASINAGMIMLDDQMAALLNRLEQRDLLANTLIVFVGDHSVVGKGSPYAPGNHVPMLMTWPVGFASNTVVPFPVSLVDVVPTILAAAGASTPAHPFDGSDLLPALRGASTDELTDRPIFIEIGTTRSVIRGDWQYIAFRPTPETLTQLATATEPTPPDIFDTIKQPFQRINLPFKPDYFAPDQLYHLGSDPFCRVNLIDRPEHAKRLAALRNDLATITAELPRNFPQETPSVMTTPAYRAAAAAAYRAAAAANPAYDREQALNLNLATPDEASEPTSN